MNEGDSRKEKNRKKIFIYYEKKTLFKFVKEYLLIEIDQNLSKKKKIIDKNIFNLN